MSEPVSGDIWHFQRRCCCC